MNILSQFFSKKYQKVEQLNSNSQGGRITYKAFDKKRQKYVVIKQFRFAKTSEWGGYKELEREIEVLQGLDHSGIPKYFSQFDSGDGLCLVQEYIEAKPLSHTRSFSPEEIKSIAIQLLEILVYLQERIPPIFHRDIKPENILVDDKVKAYLVDFGLAKIDNGSIALSSIMGGTFGFMPPEQIHNQRLTESSDLYGLGATLICLITQTKSSEIGNLVDFATNKITFKNKAPKFNRKFIRWLEKMVEPNPNNRYDNASTALEALKPLDVIRDQDISLIVKSNKKSTKISRNRIKNWFIKNKDELIAWFVAISTFIIFFSTMYCNNFDKIKDLKRSFLDNNNYHQENLHIKSD